MYFSQLESTNQTATHILSKNTPSDGTVIYTYNQTAGRGQIGSKWESEPDKNISLSLILYPPTLHANRQFLLSQTIALGVYDFLRLYLTDFLSIKWPNDLYYKDKKIAGLLIQNQIHGSTIQSSIAGIGININQLEFKSDAPNPVSLAQILDRQINLEHILSQLCQALDRRYSQFQAHQWEYLEKDYQRLLYKKDQVSSFRKKNGEIFSGIIKGVRPSGRLIIDTEKGVQDFGVKEVTFLKS